MQGYPPRDRDSPFLMWLPPVWIWARRDRGNQMLGIFLKKGAMVNREKLAGGGNHPRACVAAVARESVFCYCEWPGMRPAGVSGGACGCGRPAVASGAHRRRKPGLAAARLDLREDGGWISRGRQLRVARQLRAWSWIFLPVLYAPCS